MVFQQGKKIVSEPFVFFFLRNHSEIPRYAIYTNKKYGTAVSRNRAKRMLRSALQHLSDGLGNYSMIFIPRRKMKTLTFWQIVDEMQKIFISTGISKSR